MPHLDLGVDAGQLRKGVAGVVAHQAVHLHVCGAAIERQCDAPAVHVASCVCAHGEACYGMTRLQPRHAKSKHLMGDEQTALPLLRMLSSCRLFSMVGSSNHGKSAQN